MAQLANAEAPRGVFADVAHLLAPLPGRWGFALRLAVICALTTLVTELYQTPEPALTAYVVFFVNKPDRAESTILAIAMLIIVTIVIAWVLLLAMAVIDEPMLRVANMAAISFLLLFLASASKLKPLASIIALVVAYALDLLGGAPVSELVTRALLYAWLFVGIPAAVSLSVNLLAAPPPRRLAERALAERLDRAADLLRAPSARTREAFAECVDEGMKEIGSWLKLASVEHSSSRGDIAALHQAAAATSEILLLVGMIDSDAAAAFPPAHRETVANVLEEMASILGAGGYPKDISIDDATAAVDLSPLGTAIFAQLRAAITQFCEPYPDSTSVHAAKAPSGFFLPDAFTNVDHVRYALKTTAAAMFCYLLYSLLDWPGIHTAMITCYIVSLGTAAETVEKLTLRILGCIIGAAIGIATLIFIIPHLDSIGALMIVVFVGALAGAWIAGGSPRISYVGFQFAFAFFLCVIQGAKPGFDMVLARDRVIGILLGDLVVYLLFTNVWPVSVAVRIDTTIAAILQRLSALARGATVSARRASAVQVGTALGDLNRDLALARYEPASIRPTPDWLEVRSRAADTIAALEAPVLLSAGEDAAYSAQIAQRLDRLAVDLGAEEAASEVGVATAQEETVPLELRVIIDQRLATLERTLIPRDTVEAREADAPA